MGENAVRYLRDNLTLAQAAQAYFELISGTEEKTNVRVANQALAAHSADACKPAVPRPQIGSREGTF